MDLTAGTIDHASRLTLLPRPGSSGNRHPCSRVLGARSGRRLTQYRWQRQSAAPATVHAEPKPQPRALSEAERDEVVDVLHVDRFVDLAPMPSPRKLDFPAF